MCAAQELLEWHLREKEIDNVQAARLAALAAAIEARDGEGEFHAAARVDLLKRTHGEAAARAIAGIARQRIGTLRKLGKARAGADVRHGRGRDIIADYAHDGSAVYAPVARTGVHPDKLSARFEVRAR